MQQLRFVGVHDDGEHLVLESTDSGQRFQVLIDSSLRNAVVKARRAHPARGLSGNGEFGPRDIQTRFRQGATVDEIVAESGWKPERVRRYEWPIMAERSHVVAAAQHTRITPLGDPSDPRAAERRTLHHQVVEVREHWNFAEGDAQWNSWQREDGLWNVSVSVDYSRAALEQIPAGSDFPARFVYNPANQTVVAGNAVGEFLLGRTLRAPEPSPTPAAAPEAADPETAAPESTAPKTTAPEATAPEAAAPEAAAAVDASSAPHAEEAPAAEDEPSSEAAAGHQEAEQATEQTAVESREGEGEDAEHTTPRLRSVPDQPVPDQEVSAEEALLDALESRRGRASEEDPAADDEVRQLSEALWEQSPAEKAEQESSRKENAGGRGKNRRPSVPSWDDIVFGNRH